MVDMEAIRREYERLSGKRREQVCIGFCKTCGKTLFTAKSKTSGRSFTACSDRCKGSFRWKKD